MARTPTTSTTAGDSLATYRVKRDFQKTSEPSGATRPTTSNGFLVQKHEAKHVVRGGLSTEALLADVIVRKYADHGPFYRQAQALRRQGIEIDRGTMCNWAGR